jgi:hypothetical protein
LGFELLPMVAKLFPFSVVDMPKWRMAQGTIHGRTNNKRFPGAIAVG